MSTNTRRSKRWGPSRPQTAEAEAAQVAAAMQQSVDEDTSAEGTEDAAIAAAVRKSVGEITSAEGTEAAAIEAAIQHSLDEAGLAEGTEIAQQCSLSPSLSFSLSRSDSFCCPSV